MRIGWSGQVLRARRVMALAAAALFAVSWFERALPDIHDGDGSPATQVSTDSHAPEAQQHRPPADTEHSSLPRDGTSHPVHVDHCSHSHVAAAVRVWNFSPPLVGRAPQPMSTGDALLSVEPGTHFRPPIA